MCDHEIFKPFVKSFRDITPRHECLELAFLRKYWDGDRF